MKKFGFKKKGEVDDEASSRSALFGRSSKNSSPAPASSNPYAAPQAAADPYAQDTNKYANMGTATPPSYGPSGPSPYQQARQGLPTGPGAGRGLPGGPRGGFGGSPAPNR